jgi:hypothetical protein
MTEEMVLVKFLIWKPGGSQAVRANWDANLVVASSALACYNAESRESKTRLATTWLPNKKNAPKDCNLAALEIPSIFLIHQYQVQVVPRRKFLIDVAECRCQFKAAEEETNWNCFA